MSDYTPEELIVIKKQMAEANASWDAKVKSEVLAAKNKVAYNKAKAKAEKRVAGNIEAVARFNKACEESPVRFTSMNTHKPFEMPDEYRRMRESYRRGQND